MCWKSINLRFTARLCLFFALFCAAGPAFAHEIPENVQVQAFVRPEGQVLNVLLRVPLAAMRDMDLPMRGPGYIVFSEADEHLHDAATIWLADYLAIYEGSELLSNPRVVAARASLPGDRSFTGYEEALAHTLGGRVGDEVDLFWEHALFDVLLEYRITSDASNFSIEPGLAHLGIRTNTTLRFLPPGGAERVFQYFGDPGLVRLDPRWHQASLTFVKLGFEHILEGLDHLLFIFCLVIPFRRLRPLITVVTAFTVAHSITLMAAAFGFAPTALWFPPLIEVLIALSIVYMAFENMVGVDVQRRWMVAFGFGLVHGFGFSFLLTESLQFAGSHLVSSLLAFNVGVELGQILVVLLAIPVLELVFRKVLPEKTGTIIFSALVAHTAWHWMTERGGELSEFQFQWPVMDAMLLASLMRWGMLLLVSIGAGWLFSELLNKLSAFGAGKAPEAEI